MLPQSTWGTGDISLSLVPFELQTRSTLSAGRAQTKNKRQREISEVAVRREIAGAWLYTYAQQVIRMFPEGVGHPDPIQFYDFLENRVLVVFRPKSQQVSHDYPEISAVLSKKNTYDTISAEASENLQHNAAYLRFTSTHLTSGSPKSVLQRSRHRNLADIMGPDDRNATKITILYEKLI
ncbi:ICP0-binding domain of ubiquitin-specific protease 7-domain-containing protein [Mycena rebaudengoi]|nr:ICP0-binding domain of ubiquitin-specific protease 7-domain-containing protein [Mycena rebaudengoi]KAJ7244453.1 ICP0-binding domain of ubiquitin-specific protease 7-domain-containing protein [Mycena rebaudengoi]